MKVLDQALYLYLLLVDEQVVLDESTWFLPAALQVLQVKVVEGIWAQPDLNPGAAGSSWTQ